LANKPSALVQLAGRLAKKGINIDCAYATMPKGAKKAVVVLAASKPGGAEGRAKRASSTVESRALSTPPEAP